MRGLLITLSAAVLVVAGYLTGTTSGGQPYGTDDVLRAFRSSGIDLSLERQNGAGRCSDLDALPRVTPDGVECWNFVPDEEPTVPVGTVPRVKLWNDLERQSWVIWLYDNEDEARDVVAHLPPSRLDRQLRVARAANVVLLFYGGAADPSRLFGALARLSEG